MPAPGENSFLALQHSVVEARVSPTQSPTNTPLPITHERALGSVPMAEVGTPMEHVTRDSGGGEGWWEKVKDLGYPLGVGPIKPLSQSGLCRRSLVSLGWVPAARGRSALPDKLPCPDWVGLSPVWLSKDFYTHPQEMGQPRYPLPSPTVNVDRQTETSAQPC